MRIIGTKADFEKVGGNGREMFEKAKVVIAALWRKLQGLKPNFAEAAEPQHYHFSTPIRKTLVLVKVTCIRMALFSMSHHQRGSFADLGLHRWSVDFLWASVPRDGKVQAEAVWTPSGGRIFILFQVSRLDMVLPKKFCSKWERCSSTWGFARRLPILTTKSLEDWLESRVMVDQKSDFIRS